MKETKPTAKAATTVVSTPSFTAVVGRELRVQPPRVVVVERRRGPPRPRPGRRRQRRAATDQRRRARAAPARSARGRRRGRTPCPRARQDAGAELLDERVLDLLLVLPHGDLAADERALLVGDGGGGDVERGLALDAHHLVLDVGQRGPAAAPARGQHGERRARGRIHAFSFSSGGSVASSHFWSTGPRRWRRSGPGGRPRTSPGRRARHSGRRTRRPCRAGSGR